MAIKNMDEIYQYLSIFFLIEVRTFGKVMDIIRAHKEEMRAVYMKLAW